MRLKDLLPDLPFPIRREEVQGEYFYALVIGSHEVVASIWGVTRGALDVINVAEVSYQTTDELLSSASQALDEVTADFQPLPERILFGVPDNWLQDDNLKDEYLDLLKKLVDELQVNPMAYVSTTHAICHLLQRQSGVPVTAILVKVADPIVVTVVKGGKILGTKLVSRGEYLAIGVEKALTNFTNIEVLPSRIDLYGSVSEDMQHYKDRLLSHNWMSSLPFLHLPKVEVLEDDVSIKAVSLAGASEINPNIIYHPQTLTQVDRQPLLSHPLPESVVPYRNIPKEGDADLSDSGFVSGDISEMEGGENLNENGVELPDEPDNLPTSDGQYLPGKAENLNHPSVQMSAPLETIESEVRGKLALALMFSRRWLHKLPVPRQLAVFNFWLVIPILVLLAATAAYIYLPKASVTVYIDPKVLEKDAQITADPNITKVDETNNEIPGKIVETDVTGSNQATATGTKQIGNPAKGQVVIYNETNSPKTFSQGTVLTGPSNLLFTLNQSVTIASESANTNLSNGLNVTTFGKSDPVNVAAQAIGPDSNLASGTLLSIQSLPNSSYYAQVTTSLSGGTSKNVTVVTVDDQKKLLAALTSKLRNQAQSQLQGKLQPDDKILPEALNEQIMDKTYSKNVGDEASDFTLTLTVHYKGTVYSDNDLKQVVSKLVQVQGNIPSGYHLDLADSETQADVSKLEDDGKLVFLARFNAKLIPDLDVNELKNEIRGKTPQAAQRVLQGINNVIGADVSVHPSLPGLLYRLPLLTNHIDLRVTTK